MQLRFRLVRPLDERMMTQIVNAHTIYGIQRMQLAPAQDQIMVEYDASRLKPADVDATLARAGIPVEARN
ncbi:MAG: hypothetical protein HYX25_08135 [Candidatus Solibacter usitatus]|nr:hypothetical protein [Candidatus Solibacter usitatus]